jgi:5-formyltetrahydrofolate cyclo-ligase
MVYFALLGSYSLIAGFGRFFTSSLMKMDKFAVRRDMKRRRDSMSLDNVLSLSRAIEARLFACRNFVGCQKVMFFLSFGNEVHTDRMITRALRNQKQVYAPRLIREGKQLEVCEVNDMDEEFELGSYNIREPSLYNSNVVSPAIIDAVITPGLAFDRYGGRVGFGGGCFDWLFKQLPDKALRLGVSYGFQVVDSVPQDPWDERVQTIFTDNDTINC